MPSQPPLQSGDPTEESLAIIDLGTNTFHLLLVNITDRESFTIREKYKETVRLGEGGITSGIIAPEAFERGIRALVRFRQIIDARGVSRILAYGTSALRSASNALEFQQRAQREARIEVKIINGNEEAALIYKGVRGSVQFPHDEDVLVIDIGGGSTEFIVGNHVQAKLLRSLRLGAARLLETIQPNDPISRGDVQQTRRYIAEQADGLIQEIRDFPVTRIIGSSGSFETLAALVAAELGDALALENLNGYKLDRKKLRRVHLRLMQATRAERLAMPGMDATRVDMILMASILVDYVMEKTGLEQVMVSTSALKEGILYDYLESTHTRHHDEAERTLRDKAIRALGRKYGYDADHGTQVSKLATQLFDQLQDLHGLGEEERDLLKYAALLHDIGYFINRSGHHKHGQYIVMNSGLQGFSSEELTLLGNIMRYHRKSLPTREHFHYNVLYKEHKDIVRKLAGILRIADNLDRTHRSAVQSVHATLQPMGVLKVTVLPTRMNEPHEIDVELENARANTDLFAEAFGLLVLIVGEETGGLFGGKA